MIVREKDDAFVLIEQHHHAQVAAEIIQHFPSLYIGSNYRKEAVLYAIAQHDRGWRLFDQQPFWNDKSRAPYSFIDFPIKPKSILYTQGIDEVETFDPYAAILCSAHYVTFMERSQDEEAALFVVQEKTRMKRLLNKLHVFDEEEFAAHIALLQLADNISLYVCLHEPGVSEESIHPFFKKGIPAARKLGTERLQAYWKDLKTIIIQGLPRVPIFSVKLKYKKLTKALIQEYGLLEAYTMASYGEKVFQLKIQ